MTKGKRSSDYPYKPVSIIANGIKYTPGRAPARVCPVPAVAPPPLSPLERHMAESLQATADHIQQLRGELDQSKQGGRPESATTAHIRQLVAAHPTDKPAALYKLRDRSIIKSMDKGSWRTRIAEARRK
jgi:hypothetical protein